MKTNSTSNKGAGPSKLIPSLVTNPVTIVDTRPLREEAEARFQIRNLEKELAPGRPSREVLERLANAIGPGQSTIVHDRTGAPFALAYVRAGRSTLNVDEVLHALADFLQTPQETVRARFSKPGKPYWEFKEATL